MWLKNEEPPDKTLGVCHTFLRGLRNEESTVQYGAVGGSDSAGFSLVKGSMLAGKR